MKKRSPCARLVWLIRSITGIRFRLGIAGLLGMLVGTPPLLAQRPDIGQKLALLVGVKTYDHNKLADLKYTENDVNEMADVLEAAGYDVTLLTSSVGAKDERLRPTGINIRRELEAILKGRTKRDMVLIGLAGHGLQPEEQQDNYFCPTDGDPGEVKTLVSLADTYHRLDQSGAGVKLLLVDACRNDPNTSRGLDGDNAPRPPKGVGALFSCSPGERAFETKDLGGGHGVFFHFVLEGLRGAAKNEDQEVTWDRLREYVKRQVSREVPVRIREGAKQHPNEMGNLTGEPPVLLQVEQVESEADAIVAVKRLGGSVSKPSADDSLSVFWENSRIGDEDLRHLRALSRSSKSIFLSLNGSQVTDRGLRYLRGLTGLHMLSLDETSVGDAGLRYLQRLPNLIALYLRSTKVTDAGLIHLRTLPELWQLGLENTSITDAGLAELSNDTRLNYLFLAATKVTDVGLAHLRGLSRINMLTLCNTPVTNAGLTQLENLTRLAYLDLAGTEVTDAGMKHLEKLTMLSYVDLSNTKVSDEGLQHLRPLTQLFHLDLANTKVSDQGLKHLQNLLRLQDLVLAGTRVSDAGIQQFKRDRAADRLREADRLQVRERQQRGETLTWFEKSLLETGSEIIVREKKFDPARYGRPDRSYPPSE